MHSCETYQPMLSAYLDGEVSGPDLARAKAALAECPECRAYFGAITAASQALHRVLVDEPLPGEAQLASLWLRLAAQLPPEGAPTPRLPWPERLRVAWQDLIDRAGWALAGTAAASAAVAALVVGIGLSGGEAPKAGAPAGNMAAGLSGHRAPLPLLDSTGGVEVLEVEFEAGSGIISEDSGDMLTIIWYDDDTEGQGT